MPNDQKLKKTVKRSIDQKLRLRTFDVRSERNETGAAVTSRRVKHVLKEDNENAINGKQKDSVREETTVVSHMMKTSVQIRHRKTLHFSESQKQRGGSASRKKNLRCRSPSAKFARQPCRDYLKGTCTKSPCDDWHLPECQFYKSGSGWKFGDKSSVAQAGWGSTWQKGEKGWWQKCSGFVEKCSTVRLRISGHSVAWILSVFYGRADEYDSEELCCVMQASEKSKVRRSEKIKSKFLISAVRTIWNWRIGLWRRLKDRSDVPAETCGDWPRIS